MKFIHLHNHSDYSVLDGGITVDRLIARAKELRMPGIALTDHGNMFGAIDFYQKARKAEIKPIIGQEFYVAPGSRFKKESARGSGGETAYHLILLARNEEGYRNLLKLSSLGYTEGFYYKPRIDMELIEKHSGGLICSSACIAGEIPSAILRDEGKRARELSGRFAEIFGKDHFYLELQYHGLEEQVKANRELIKISSELDIPLIATNDAHYVNREDAYSHEVLLCIQTGKIMEDENRMRFSSDQFYLKTAEEMNSLFSKYPGSLSNTWKIYEMIDLELELGNPVLPRFDVPEGYNLDTYLNHLVYQGAEKRYGSPLPDDVVKRIEYELSVIRSMHFPGYFLIVWDFINEARKMNIPVGPGRGSAAGSIIAYCLDITALDPLKYDLLFERFLNPDRNEMPDMDLDFCAERREEIIDYIKRKYGEDHVSQIITYNKMTSKAVVKDVARTLNIPFATANDISKYIDQDTLQKSIDSSKELQALRKDEEMGKELLEISLRLEGLIKSAGKHAAGVVISKGPLTDYVPLYKDKDGYVSSQYDMKTLERAGLVKMDILGLRNLTIIDKCLKLIEETEGKKIDIKSIPLDDKKVYALLQRADTKGIFQLEKSGMQNLLKKLEPTCFEDIIAIVALYRPGPLESGMTENFIERKRTPSLVSYPHPSLEPVLKDTLGVVIYQEQVMLISQVMGGFTLPEADRLRKAMGKKIMAIVDELEPKFLEGAAAKNIDKNLAQNVYNMMKEFAKYGFNKSHSAAYALISYQTAYLKAYFPLQFMTALLSAQPDKQDDVIQYIADCKEMGIDVLQPLINKSDFDFVIEGGSIRFGLGAVKGLGGKAIEDIVQAREESGGFATLKDFLENISTATLNKGVFEALIKSGALDEHYPERGRLFNSIDILMDTAKRYQEDRISGQGDLFGGESSGSGLPPEISAAAGWEERERLDNEKEVLGLYISGHPLAEFSDEISALSSVSISGISEEHRGRDVTIIGLIRNLEIKRSQKNNREYGRGTLEDLDGTIGVLLFSSTLKKFREIVMSNQPVAVKGRVESESDFPSSLIVSEVKTLNRFRRESISAIHIKLDPGQLDNSVLESLKSAFMNNRGDCPIYFHVDGEDNEKIIKAHSTFNIEPSEDFVKDLARILGNKSLRYTIGHNVLGSG